ncbi:MAG TPA: MarR family transcriptional regulator [Puia sp.]|jgi:DNA-binding MarR family transcriptional regulator
MTKKQKDYDVVSGFVDAVITVRQAIKQLAQQKIREWHDRELTYEMLQVIMVLWRKNQVNQQEVANTVQKNKASLTPLIDKLVKLNLVTRSEDPNDRRNKIISLTIKGKEYKKKFSPMLNEIYGLIGGHISDEKLKDVSGVLLTLSGKITDRR